MNILTLTSCYPVAHSPADGIFIRSQCEALAAAGATVTVFAPRPWVPPGLARLSTRWHTYRATPTYYELNGIPVHRPRHLAPPRSDLWMPVARQYQRAAARQFRTPPDLLHAHFAYPGGVAGIHLARQWGVPVVLTLHGDDVNTHPGRSARLRRALCFAVAEADAVIAVSEALADRTAALTGRRPTVAPIGVNLGVFAPAATQREARQTLGLPTDRWIALHLGRLVEEKGIRDLLQALNALPEPGRLGLFVGQGPLADAVRATPHCLHAGVQPNERVALYMRAADVFVLPSYSEGMPTVLVEAGAAGLPIIATAVGGIPELLSGQRGCIVPPRSAAALTAAMADARHNPGAGAARAARLTDFVRARYDVQRNAAQLRDMYGPLIAAGRRGQAAAARPVRTPGRNAWACT